MHAVFTNAVLVAVSANPLPEPLAVLLAKQRTEEPETPLNLVEVSRQEQAAGLAERRYSLGLYQSLQPAAQSKKAISLWKEDLAVALPLRSPLLVDAEIPASRVADYPLVLCQAAASGTLSHQIEAYLLAAGGAPLNVIERASSFGLMMVMAAAGYGIGVATGSRILAARQMGIVMRPVSGARRAVITYLALPEGPLPSHVTRFIRRAMECGHD
ncbi:LysR substrate-binding domain-containing protein [Pseudomonas citronellolis]|uniref:LysR substrate-binding domain-containing protein n=1 Tax=Pseudomonas citronellolis TaxID=53408 RepID=UPI00248D6ABC|nr:LysR substrate-binding domain-containing protein [Pseudomonas citronellolis]